MSKYSKTLHETIFCQLKDNRVKKNFKKIIKTPYLGKWPCFKPVRKNWIVSVIWWRCQNFKIFMYELVLNVKINFCVKFHWKIMFLSKVMDKKVSKIWVYAGEIYIQVILVLKFFYHSFVNHMTNHCAKFHVKIMFLSGGN